MLMLPAYTDVPIHEVNGKFMAIDFGGTNFRCLLVEIEKGKMVQNWQQSVVIDPKTPTAEKLLAVLGQVVEDFVKAHPDQLEPHPEVLPAGYTFSFPVKQTSLNSGVLVNWTKEFIAEGCVGHDPTEQLQGELNRRGLGWIHVKALCNDTVGTLCSKRLEDTDCVVGVILGTGTNACYREKLSNIKKLTPPPADYKSDKMLINMEWGSFDGMPPSPIDEALWKRVDGNQKFEKMISGRYCPMLAAQALDLAMQDGFLPDLCAHMKAAGVPRYNPHTTLSLIEISKVHHDTTADLSETRKVLVEFSGVEDKDIKITQEELTLVKELFTAIVIRAARLSGIAMAALVARITMHVEVMPRICIGVDGSVFHKYTGFADEIRATVKTILSSVAGKSFAKYKDLSGAGVAAFPTSFPEVSITGAVDGSGLGAAVIVAANTQ